jgi:release factor glutamine methyltransferase
MKISDVFLQEDSLSREVLLAHVLHVNRSYLYAHPEQGLTSDQEKFFFELTKRYERGEPVSYITGHREFWSLDLKVTRDTLVPRQETELLVELVLQNVMGEKKIIADLGTGSGAIALAVAHEKPDWTVYATDISEKALHIAEQNAKGLKINNVNFYQSEWFSALPDIKFDAIISNPPYLDKDDPKIAAAVLDYEPRIALISEDAGLRDMKKIIFDAPQYLKPDGYLFLEHGFQQGEKIKKIFAETGYTNVYTYCDLAGLERATLGQWQDSDC